MAHAQIPAEVDVLAQRQHAAGAQHPPVADDDGAVVHGCFDKEDIFQKLAGDRSIQHGAAADHIVQQNLPFKDDQGTGAGLGHLRASQYSLANGSVHGVASLGMGEKGNETAAAHLLQDPADLRLEQDDESHSTILLMI